jgi:hypothetical protein
MLDEKTVQEIADFAVVIDDKNMRNCLISHGRSIANPRKVRRGFR